jgi:5'-nucleotidase
MRILLINDDGSREDKAKGTYLLRDKLMDLGHIVYTVLPLIDASGASFSMNIPDTGIDVHEIAPYVYGVNGTPVSCVIYGMHKFQTETEKFDLVVSGPNVGDNKDLLILSSGTCAGALFASLQYQIPAVAFSVETRGMEVSNWEAVVAAAVDVISLIEKVGPKKGFINVNLPNMVTKPDTIVLTPFIPYLNLRVEEFEGGGLPRFIYKFDYPSDNLYNYDVIKMTFVSVETDITLLELFNNFAEKEEKKEVQ